MGFQLTHPNRNVIQLVGMKSDSANQEIQYNSTSAAVKVILNQKLCLGPFQSKMQKLV